MVPGATARGAETDTPSVNDDGLAAADPLSMEVATLTPVGGGTYQEDSAAVRYRPVVKWTPVTDGGASGGSYKQSNTKNGTSRLAVIGAQDFSWIPVKGPDKGIAQVYVDNKLVDTQDLYSPTLTYLQALGPYSLATAGRHTIRIKVSRQKNPASSDYFVSLDYYSVTPRPPTPTRTPTNTKTPTKTRTPVPSKTPTNTPAVTPTRGPSICDGVQNIISRDTTWSPGVYVADSCDITVKPGATLTLLAGAIVKIGNNPQPRNIWVNGNLVAQGTDSDPVIFTSTNDNSVGGVASGVSSLAQPAPGNWGSLTTVSALRHCPTAMALLIWTTLLCAMLEEAMRR